MSAPHDVPTASELLEAVRDWIDDVGASGEPVNRFHARVATNVLAIVERELELGPQQAERHAERLASLGAADDAELASAIRSGTLDDRADEVRALVWESVRDKLAVANPRYLDRVEPAEDE
jgi:hypothetical protein